MHPDDIRVREGEFEVFSTFQAIYNSTCTINNSHKIKRNDRIGRVRRISNPLLPVPGYACQGCLKLLPRSTETS